MQGKQPIKPSRIHGFPPVVDEGARVLVLGSMPGIASLERNQYYGLPRNAFWKIMGDLFDAGANIPYERRLDTLRHRGVALWDVLASCYRPGSLDSAIHVSTARINDFESFFRKYREITHVFFNGRKAAQLFDKCVLRQLSSTSPERAYVTLPSTSPAHASLTYEQKIERWIAVRTALESESAGSPE